ncbi:MAG: 50S ribosomal protein L9 [Mangrovibacterium sp.]
MEVILLEDIQNLGHKDDIVNVKAGYGRNYLIPQKMAIVATDSTKKILAENIKQRAHKEAKLIEEAQALAAKFEGVEVKIGAKTSESGKIFGSVNTIQLADAINAKGFDLDRKQIRLPKESIKEVGSYTAQIKLHREVIIDFNFEVVSE